MEEKYFLSQKIIKTILGHGTKNYIVNPTIDLKVSKTLTATMMKMHRTSQDNYVTDIESHNLLVNSEKTTLRKLTPIECARLQGFPSDWVQVVSDAQAYKQFGNAVTVDVSYYVAKALLDYLNSNQK